MSAALVIGLTSVVAQILVPFAANLAPPEQRGKFVGQVMSGLLLGILLARSVSSLAASAWGWRSIYLISAVLMLLTSIAIRRVLPKRTPKREHSYRSLLRSTLGLARSEPVVLRRALAQALLFGSFTAFWTGVTYELIDEHGLSQSQVALFALIAAAGAVTAPLAGKLGDRGFGDFGRGAALLLATAAMLLAWLGASELVLLAVGGLLLEIAVQTHLILSQRDIYSVREDARARLNSIFMTTMFVGGALASAVTGLLHGSHGWSGVAIFAACLPAVGALGWAIGRIRN